MPFDSSFNDTYVLGIKAACNDLDVYCERIDEQIFTESILDRIYNQIAKADIIVADMTGRNANVFYETGFSHALQKKVILLTQNADDIPFDLKHYHHIVYGGSILKLKEELVKRIDWFINNPFEKKLPNIMDFDYYFRGQKIEDGCIIEIQKTHPYLISTNEENQTSILNFQLDIFNPNERLIKVEQQITITAPNIFFENDNLNIKTIRLPDGKYMHICKGHEFELYPKMWDFMQFNFKGAWQLQQIKEPFLLKIHNTVEVRETVINISIVE